MNKAEQLIACLEGEIAKRDARIVELESQYQRDVWGLNNECDPIGGDPAGGYANDNARLRSELAAIKAQGVVMPAELDRAFITGESCDGVYRVVIQSETLKEMQAVHRWLARLNAAPVQQVSVPDASTDFSQFLSAVMDAAGLVRHGRRSKELSEYLGSKCMEYRCFAAPAAPAADAGLVEARKANNELVNDLHVMTNKRHQLVDALTYLRECLDPDDYMGEISMHDFIDDALAAHRAKGVV